MEIVIVTNNPEVGSSTKNPGRVLNIDGGPMEVLLAARQLVYRGYRVLSHPLAGSVKPWQNPYRSIALQKSATPRAGRDIFLIENAITRLAGKSGAGQGQPTGSYEPQTLAEFRLLDKELINQVWDTAQPASGGNYPEL